MQRSLFAVLILAAAACGSQEVDGPGTTHIDGPGSTIITLPGATQRELLQEARLTWTANRPSGYEITYELACECDGGPRLVRVEGGQTVVAERVGLEPGRLAPYRSVEAIFDEIETTLDEDRFPVNVEYDSDFGYPRSYIFNEPELPVDGGFVLTVSTFEANPSPGDPKQHMAFVEARTRWEDTGIVDYDYMLTRGCFCPQEYIGPYLVSVQEGEVTAATFEGTDLLDIDLLEVNRYDEIVKTVDDVFTEIDRALREADSFRAEYHPELGYPTNVFIDWIANAADDEVGYTIELD